MQSMKIYDQTRTRQAEAVQMIILHSLFSAKESKEIIFQGGTAIKWFYGGLKFSEDLDFVTSLPHEKVTALVNSVAEHIRRQLVGNFGAGTFSVKEKKFHPSSYRAFVDFLPSGMRSKISVKIEFEKLMSGIKPESDRKIMQTSPAVSYFLQQAGLKMPGTPVLVNIETSEEILSDKLRALMERVYTRGRDFFDLWFLTNTLQIPPGPEILKKKLDMYEVPFTITTPISFYTNMDTLDGKVKVHLVDEIYHDLARFVSNDVLKTLKQDNFRELITSVQNAFKQIQMAGTIDFSKYPTRHKGTKQ